MFMNHNRCILELCGLRGHLQGMEKRITEYRSFEKIKWYESNLHLNFDMQNTLAKKRHMMLELRFTLFNFFQTLENYIKND